MGKRALDDEGARDAPAGAKRLHTGEGDGYAQGAASEAQRGAGVASGAQADSRATSTGDEGLAFRLREPGSPVDAATPTTVMAPAFRAVYDSWEAFDAALKFYSQATFQLYVIRTTTSVKRRNQRIAEAAPAPSAGQEDAADAAPTAAERALIPERFEWYSKTLMCTHGWKDRHRGNGKRAMSSIRSTSCPARMCVTLQHRGGGDADWQVVVTKHQRQHNHPLSRELYFYYLENRRIYDPELLAVGGDTPAAPTGAWRPDIDPRELLSTEVQQTPPPSDTPSVQAPETTPPAVPASTSSARVDASATQIISEAADSKFVLRSDATATFVHATRAFKKVHESWDAFNTYMTDYSESTNQVFRTRSTVSVAAKNAKTIERGTKAGRTPEETAALLIPEELKWYSKMLICNHGWKRKSRRKMASSYYGSSLEPLYSGDEGSSSAGNPVSRNACPATLLVRLERDANDTWRVVINRQIVEHNHALTLDVYDGDGVAATIVPPASGSATTNTTGTPNNDADERQQQVGDGQEQLRQRLTTDDHEVVVRVPRLQNVFTSWEDFHENLKIYSDATYQLYCTRTTTSVVNRNRKIMALKQQLEVERRDDGEEHDAESSATAENNSETRMIPEQWKWYNKTLMCTHGWKRRPRGVGKRVANVVRSTQCPVKICATVQYVEHPSGALTQDGEAGGWRVVVTKHIIDHNHNLSRALYEHYRENRRIYDPDLLTIDETNEAAVVKPKASGVEMTGTEPPQEYLPSPESATAKEIVMHESDYDANATSVGTGDGSSFLQVGSVPAPQPIPSVVILPYQSSIPSGISSAPTPQNHRQGAPSSSSAASSNSAMISSGSAVATLATLAGPQSQMYVPYHIPEAIGSGRAIVMNGAIVARQGFSTMGAQSGSAVYSLACPVHNGSGAVVNVSSGFSDACTCFRLAPSAPYVTIAPSRASPHMMAIPPATDFENVHANEHAYPDQQQHGDGYTGQEDAGIDGDVDLEPTGDAWVPGAPTASAVPVVNDSGETMWRVAPMVRRHANWDTFHNYLDEYSAATLQLFSVRTTTAVSSRNARIIQQIDRRNGSEESASTREMALRLRHLEATGQILPPKFEWYAKTFLCTHGWKRRRRGIGKRVGHSVRSTQCPAKICATLQHTTYPSNGPGVVKKWRVVVTKQVLEHNHEISHAMYQKYSESRRVKDPEVMRAAERLWRSGSTRRQVFEFIKERAPQVPILMKDVHNIVQRWKKNPPSDGLDSQGREGEGSGEGGQDEGGELSSADVMDGITVDQ